MTEDQIRLVQQTSGVLLGSAAFADRFYDRLFELAPDTRPLFAGDMAGTKLKFMNMLATLIGALDRPDVFSSVPRHLGTRHHGYGVEPRHYAPVGEALIDTLRAELEQRFTADVSAAWTALYAEVSGAMQSAPRR
jgi:hemoglobin-like flavoprotein